VYKPPKVTRYPDLERGLDVQCPAASGRKTAAQGKLKAKPEDIIVSRSLCLARSYGAACEMCPNTSFEVIVKNIGPAKKYDWVLNTIKKAVLATGGTISKTTREHGDCCPEHHNTVIITVKVDLPRTEGFIDKKGGLLIYDMIMKAGKKENHVPVHVKLQKHEDSFTIVVALHD
jgi:hypothetical protein